MARFNIRKWLQSRERKGEELDPTPIALPEGMRRPMSLEEQMKRFIREELSYKLSEQTGEEKPTFEEEDDFQLDEPDDGLPDLTQYTLQDLHEDQEPLEQAPQEGSPNPVGGAGDTPADNAQGAQPTGGA